MEESKPEGGPAELGGWASAMIADGPDKRQRLEKAATELRLEMEAAAEDIRALVAAQPPTELIGYLWSQVFLSYMTSTKKNGDGPTRDGDLIQEIQFVLEYIHAIWSSHQGSFATGHLDEPKAKRLLDLCRKLSNTAMFYAMTSSQIGQLNDFAEATPDVEFKAKSTWLLVRGHRYQVLEGEFFEFALSPHEDALKTAYGIGVKEIAGGIQSITDSLRVGYADAAMQLFNQFNECRELMATEGVTLEEAAAKLNEDGARTSNLGAAVRDMFFGGICNLSRHTNLPEPLLQDMAYLPGGEDKFFAEGDFRGTPYRTLPARIRPLVKLDDGYYATDAQFVRDSAYRAIQRGLVARLPDYREGWNKNQKVMTESAFPNILSGQLKNAQIFQEVYFKDAVADTWAETDLIGVIDDVLFVVEAKAGVMAMQSPATNFESHIRTIRDLVLKAYRQCKRFLEYLASGADMPLFRLKDGAYEEVARINLKNFRRIFPIGLTVESFTPFSSMCKEIPEVAPILGSHPFISLSVDDLLVLNRLLPTAGELFHYLEVRQAVAGMPQATIFDEMDHLGAYITRNRFDEDIRKQLEEADRVAWDTFSHVIDNHFGQPAWEAASVPRQRYPDHIASTLDILERTRPRGWLRIDAEFRDYSDQARKEIESLLNQMVTNLNRFPVRRIVVGNENAIQIWLSTLIGEPAANEIRRQAEIACLAAEKPKVTVLRIQCSPTGKFLATSSFVFQAPSVLAANYAELKAEARRQLNRSKGRK